MRSTLALLVLAAVPTAQLGQPLPDADLEFVGTQATSLEDFAGRAVLIEFFAHW